MGQPERRPHTRRLILHCSRVALFAAVIVLIHLQARQIITQRQNSGPTAVPRKAWQVFFPNGVRLGETLPGGEVEVRDTSDRRLGFYLQTSPESDHVVGFSGPTNVLIALDAEGRILGLTILTSGDTKEHVQQVTEDDNFFHAFVGLSRQELAGVAEVDTVTGATLTSLAIQESILHRLGGGRQSLRFPEPLSVEEVSGLFPQAAFVEQDTSYESLWRVLGESREQLGSVLRTSPTADNLIGYQGPTESLIGLNTQGQILGSHLRKSFDNEPYVGYVREDKYFANLWNDRTLKELAVTDLQAAGVEGVSGATMTSMAMAKGQVMAAEEFLRAKERQTAGRSLRWLWRICGTAVTVVVGCLIGLTSLRSVRWLRFGFRIWLIVYLGLINGEMISQAMIAGWAQHGVPWQAASGLLLLTMVALAVPLFSRRNIYCTHLCPHGAVQQLVKNRLGWRLRISPKFNSQLKKLPGLLLAWCVLVVMWPLPYSLVGIEPFDAWVFYVAGAATITVAVLGLVAALIVPMAYCRYGCPTGAMLGYLRLHARSDRWSARDWLAVSLLLLAISLYLF